MKRIPFTLLASLVVLFSAPPLMAQTARCDKCEQQYVMSAPGTGQPGWAGVCVEVDWQQQGQAGCTGGWTDTHNGVSQPHCHFSGGACEPYYPPLQGDLQDCQSPIVIARSGGRYALSDISDPVVFDLLGYGQPMKFTWPARGSGLAFLALDRNLNGTIDSGYELFGNYAPLPADRSKTNGFAWLANYDAEPRNQMIDEFDPVWPYLLLWEDGNHDGVSQPDELSRLADSDITALGLDYVTTARRDPAGNVLRYKANLWRGGHAAPYYDVYLRTVVD